MTEVYNAMAAEIHQDDFFLAFFFRFFCFLDDAGDGVVRLRSRDEPLRPGKLIPAAKVSSWLYAFASISPSMNSLLTRGAMP